MCQWPLVCTQKSLPRASEVTDLRGEPMTGVLLNYHDSSLHSKYLTFHPQISSHPSTEKTSLCNRLLNTTTAIQNENGNQSRGIRTSWYVYDTSSKSQTWGTLQRRAREDDKSQRSKTSVRLPVLENGGSTQDRTVCCLNKTLTRTAWTDALTWKGRSHRALPYIKNCTGY